MALTGTLKDFGIAEILQLIGQQTKSGILHLIGPDDEIHVSMSDGCVVSAECAGRSQRDRLGSRLVRAELLSAEDLERALQIQRRTLRRLGDILIDLGLVSAADLKEMTALQTVETIYKLFSWKTGTYAFEPCTVDWDKATVAPIRADSLLMEGFRQVDEWPLIRRKINSGQVTFFRKADLPEVGSGTDRSEGDGAAIGRNERCVYDLAEPGRDVEHVADLSRLGEFETYKALLNLVNRGYLEVLPAPRRSAAVVGVGKYARSWRARIKRGAAGLTATVLLALALVGVGWLVAQRNPARGAVSTVGGGAIGRFLERYRTARISGALEIWRLEHGSYPERLALLVDVRLLDRADLRCPMRPGEYYYRRKAGGGFVLLPPLP